MSNRKCFLSSYSETNLHIVEENYAGLTADTFKLCHGNHKKSFKNENDSTETTLSVCIWKLKSENIDFNINWKIIDRGKSFSPVSKTCQLCTKEKFLIIFNPELASLNTRNELGSNCRHKSKLLLKNS